jgi:hypothetical protein
MSPSSIVIDLATVPGQTFIATVQEYDSRIPVRRCPTGATPLWVPLLVKNGQVLSLPTLVDHAASHFVDSVNRAIFTSGGLVEKEASALAWALISMLKPTIKQNQLWVEDPKDKDIKRLCSEILGVGAALHLLSAAQAIDFRTIKKIGGNFDYEAYDFNNRRVVIEAKGTFDGVSMDRHRKSFAKKIKNGGYLATGASRGYSCAIGIIFATWSKAERGCDVELLDPESAAEEFREESIREVIRFYAFRFGEFMGNKSGAARLHALAESANLFKQADPLLQRLGSDHRESRAFFRVILRFRGATGIQEFLGGFWEGGAVSVPYSLRGRVGEHFRYAFTGIDRAILQYIRESRFEELLGYRARNEEQFVVESDDFQGQFSLDGYGVLRGWMNVIPPGEAIFDIPGRHGPGPSRV